jgi:Spy/CpxP family protein refolding chaperone
MRTLKKDRWSRLMLVALTIALLAIPATQALAQQAGPQRAEGIAGAEQRGAGQRGAGQRGPGPMSDGASQTLGRFFYSPRQVIEQADEIGLTAEQEQAITELTESHQADFRELRFQLGNEMTRMGALAVEHPVGESAMLEQLETVLGLEAEIKRLQLRMLVQVKNLLTPEQQAQLRAGGGRGPGGGQGQGPGQGPGRGSGRGPGAERFNRGPR